MRPRTHRARSAVLGLGLLVAAAAPAAAHVPELRGRLVDLVSQSDLIVVATVEQVSAVDPHWNDTTVRVDAALVGTPAATRLRFRAHPRFAVGERFVFFLRHAGTAVECAQPSGTVFRSNPGDDAAYRNAIAAVQRALLAESGAREAALRTALIPVLSAPVPALRYHAILELGALAHHGITAAERQALEQLVADPNTDPAIRPAVISVLRTTAASPPQGS